MTNYTSFSNKNKIETFVNKAEQGRSLKPKPASLINKFFQSLIRGLTAGNELRIWQGYDRFGNEVWHAYDPGTDKHTCVDSEAKLRVWIEKRYYQ